jgi:putative flippase GtrA
MIQTAAGGWMQREGVRQFIKFCLIGFTSMVIDVGIAWCLTYRLDWNWIIARSISFLIAVSNGFIWNSIWTFRGMGTGTRHQQYMKFVGINVVGLAANILIMKSVFFLFTGRLIHQGNPDKAHWLVATGEAVVIVSCWNFLANKKWTFANAPMQATS